MIPAFAEAAARARIVIATAAKLNTVLVLSLVITIVLLQKRLRVGTADSSFPVQSLFTTFHPINVVAIPNYGFGRRLSVLRRHHSIGPTTRMALSKHVSPSAPTSWKPPLKKTTIFLPASVAVAVYETLLVCQPENTSAGLETV